MTTWSPLSDLDRLLDKLTEEILAASDADLLFALIQCGANPDEIRRLLDVADAAPQSSAMTARSRHSGSAIGKQQ